MSDEAIAFIGIGVLASLLLLMVGYVCWKVCGKCVERQRNHNQTHPSQPLLQAAVVLAHCKTDVVSVIADKSANAERLVYIELLTNIGDRSESMFSPMSSAAPSAIGSADLLLCMEQSDHNATFSTGPGKR